MRERLFIRLGARPNQLATWGTVSAEGEVVAIGHGPLMEIERPRAGARVIVLVPSELVLLTKAKVPTRNRQRVSSALPYALEEHLASDVDRLHFAIGDWREDGSISTAVIDRPWLDDALVQLESAGIQPDYVVPDVLALPLEPGCWTLLHEGEMNRVRTGAQSGFVVDTHNLVTVLPLALDEAKDDRPKKLRLLDCAGAGVEPPALALAGLDLEIETISCDTGAFAALLRSYDQRQVINLLQGTYSRTEQWGKLWRPWRPAAAMLALWVVLQVGWMVLDYYRLEREYESLRGEIVSMYQEVFPDERNVPQPRAQMERHLEALRGASTPSSDSSMLALLAGIGPAVQQTPNFELKRLNYKEGTLDLGLTISDLQRLEAFKQQLEAQGGIAAVILSATAREGGVEARLQVKAAGI